MAGKTSVVTVIWFPRSHEYFRHVKTLQFTGWQNQQDEVFLTGENSSNPKI